MGNVFAQQPQLLNLNRFDTKDRTKVTVESGLEFLAYPLTSDIVDLRDFKKHYPEVKEMDYLKLKLPDMTGHTDSTVLLGFLKENGSDPGMLVILIAGDYESESPVIFVDRTMDRSYLNDDKPIRMVPGTQQKVVLDDLGKKKKKREFYLYIPKTELTPKEKELARQAKRNSQKKDKKVKIKDQFSLGVQVMMGTQKMEYSYLNLNYGHPTWFEVHGSEKGLGFNLTYNFPRFRLGVQMNHQHLSYWSSYKFTRYDLPRDEYDAVNRTWVHFDNVLVDRNRDIMPKHRFQYGLLAAYRWQVGKNLEIQPRVTAGWFTYLPAKFTPDNRDLDEVYNVPSTPFVDAGIDFDFNVGNNQSFVFGLSYMDSDFRPTGFFEATPHENLKTNFRSTRATLGYRVGLK